MNINTTKTCCIPIGSRNDKTCSLQTWLPTRRPASADRTARRQFQATGQPVRRTQANDTMTTRLPRYDAKCVQRRCFQCGSIPLRSDAKGTEIFPANILIPLERHYWLRYNFAAESFYIMNLCSRLFVLCCRHCPKDDKFRYFIPILRKLGAAWNLVWWLVGKPVSSSCYVWLNFFFYVLRLRRHKARCVKPRCLQEG